MKKCWRKWVLSVSESSSSLDGDQNVSPAWKARSEVAQATKLQVPPFSRL